MPISTASPIVKPPKDRFYELDHLVRGHAFAIHNEFGRLMDEKIYQAELARRCVRSGLRCAREMTVMVTHESFTKRYFIDMLLAEGVPVETKVAATLLPQHRAQLLHYLFLCELNHGTLINFRPPKVEHEFVSTTHTAESRREFTIDTARWQPLCAAASDLQERMVVLLQDWGMYLELSLYREALTHFLGGEDAVVSPADILSEGEIIGRQNVHLLAEGIAFAVTHAKQPGLLEAHLRRMLAHTRLDAVAWINMNGGEVSFVTLK